MAPNTAWAPWPGAISKDADGRYHAANDADRQAILALKKDPQISALMAGEYARSAARRDASQSGPPGLRRRTLCRAFPGRRCRLQADPHQPERARRQRGGAVSRKPPAPTESCSSMPTARAKSVREVYDWAMQQPGGSADAGSRRRRQPATAAPAPRRSGRRQRRGRQYRDLAGRRDELAAGRIFRSAARRRIGVRLASDAVGTDMLDLFVRDARRQLGASTSRQRLRRRALPVPPTSASATLLDMSITLSR